MKSWFIRPKGDSREIELSVDECGVFHLRLGRNAVRLDRAEVGALGVACASAIAPAEKGPPKSSAEPPETNGGD